MSQQELSDYQSTAHECPSCDREFSSRLGLGTHHSYTHGMSINEYERRQGEHECPHCQYAFDSERSLDNHKRSQHPEELRERVECEICGEIIEAPQSHERQFCSKECRGKWSSKNKIGGQTPGPRITLTCEHCDSEFEVIPAESHSKFCSRSCYAQYRSESDEYSGENHPRWEGGASTYGQGWTPEKKEKVRARDNYTCQHPGCSITNEQHKQKYGRSLNVHHMIKAREYSDDDASKNDMSNLVALCIEHHSYWEKMSPLRPNGD